MPSRNDDPAQVRKKTVTLTRLGLLVALGTVLNLAEIPLPRMFFPWAKPGLANVATLVGIYLMGPVAGLLVASLRSILSHLLVGLIFSPGFLLSLTGSVASAGAMGLFYRRAGKHFSIISISIVGALVHNAIQLLVAYVMLVQHRGVWINLPPMMVASVATGLFNGVMASLLVNVVRAQHVRKKDMN